MLGYQAIIVKPSFFPQISQIDAQNTQNYCA
jgi:hypothetical protein